LGIAAFIRDFELDLEHCPNCGGELKIGLGLGLGISSLTVFLPSKV
jgi:hypothetical protein